MDKKTGYRVLLAEAEKLLAHSTNKAIANHIELRDAVCIYYEAERNKGVPLSAIVDSVEGILIQADGRLGDADRHKQFARELIDWCLGAYHQGDLEII